VSTAHPTFDKRVFQRECVGLAEAGNEVHLVIPHERDETVRGVRIHALPRPPNRAARILAWPWLAYRVILGLRPRPHIVHFHDPELLPVAQLLRLRGYKLVFDVHENMVGTFMVKYYLPAAIRTPMARIYDVTERFLTSGLASVVVVDGMTGRYREPRAVVRNLPNLRVCPVPLPKSFRPPWRFVYAGRITPKRGGIRMLQLVEDLRGRNVDVYLAMMGEIYPEWWARRIRAYIRDHHLADRVRLTGELPYAQCLAEMGRGHVGLCLLEPTPNYTSGLPVKGFEYMTQNLACLVSDFACYKPFFADTGAGVMVDPRDRQAIRDAALALLSDPDRLAAMARRGWQLVRNRLNWEVEQQRLLALYRRILDGRIWPRAGEVYEPPA